jgi:DNA mismatch repair protein MutS2
MKREQKMNRNRHEKTLELDKVLALLAEHAGCSGTRELIAAMTPEPDMASARRSLARTVDAHSLSNRFGTPSIYGLVPCVELLERAKVGATLSMRELLDIGVLLRIARNLLTWRRQAAGEETSLDHLFAQLVTDKALEEDLSNAILSQEEMSDHASPQLYDIRRKIRNAHQKARETLDRMVRSSTYQKYLQEAIITIRNGRFVVPVRKEYQNEVKGLVHDTSSSGATVFIEPMTVVEQNNAIRELEGLEREEIARILLAFSERIGLQADYLIGSYHALLELDLCFAKSRLADRMRATVPTLVEQGQTYLKKARHPLIDPEKIVPIDIMIGGEFDTLVITGPNTGGKTVALKTLGLLALMARCGLMLPVADGSCVCFYHKILADIGDEQSIEQSLSTFSGHMTNIVEILKQADKHSLVLIDELGAGTDPVEGAALAVAIIDRLRSLGATVAATTHYAEIKLYALETPGVENASCEFDVATLRPSYRLLIGVPGRSNAFAISQRLGLPEEIIEAAKREVSRESAHFEDVVSGLEEARQELEREKELVQRYKREAQEAREKAAQMQKSLEQRQELELRKAREEAKSLVENVRFQSRQLLEELEALKKQKDREDFSATVADVKSTFKSYLRDLENAADPVTQKPKKQENYRLPRPLKPGDSVQLMDLGSEGVVLSAADKAGNVLVQAGIMKTKVHQSNLRLLQKTKATMEGGTVNTRQAVKSAKESATASVDLRGMMAEEALMELDRYIDTAVLSGIHSITIVHGKGTGALRKAVQQHLRSHRNIRSFRAGVYGEGDAGVTIAELK